MLCINFCFSPHDFIHLTSNLQQHRLWFSDKIPSLHQLIECVQTTNVCICSTYLSISRKAGAFLTGYLANIVVTTKLKLSSDWLYKNIHNQVQSLSLLQSFFFFTPAMCRHAKPGIHIVLFLHPWWNSFTGVISEAEWSK